MDTNTISGASTATSTKTSRGTKIVKQGGDLGKDAFLRILTAELSNQDPSNTKDSTQYVSQMAQFTSLEQMSNLNATMTMSSANAMLGKAVMLNVADDKGNPLMGIVRVTSRQGSNVKLGVEITTNGKKDISQFDYSEVSGVYDTSDGKEDLMNQTINLLTQASMIGKKAEFDIKDANGKNYSGMINGIIKAGTSFNANVILDKEDGTVETKELSMDKILKLYSVSGS